MHSLTHKISTVAKRALAVSSILFFLGTACWAQANVYVQFGDGRVIRSSRSYYTRHYANQGGVVISTLPNSYVSEPYRYSNGYPVYYQQNYWRSHNRRWRSNNGNHNNNRDRYNYDRHSNGNNNNGHR